MLLHVVVCVLVGLNQHEPISVQLDRRADVEITGVIVVLTTRCHRRFLDTTSLQELSTWNSCVHAHNTVIPLPHTRTNHTSLSRPLKHDKHIDDKLPSPPPPLLLLLLLLFSWCICNPPGYSTLRQGLSKGFLEEIWHRPSVLLLPKKQRQLIDSRWKQHSKRVRRQNVRLDNIEKSQHTDFNEDTTNESASVACSNIRLWKLDTQKEWRNTSWRLWDERAEKDFVGFVDSKKKQMSGFLTKLE